MRTIKIVILFALLSGIMACEPKNDDPNHTLVITNTWGNYQAATQFVKVELTPVDGSSGTLVYDNFVSSANSNGGTTDVKVTLPKTGTYKVKFYDIRNQYVLWNSVAMDANNGRTDVYLRIYCSECKCAVLSPNECTLTLQ